MKFYNRYVSVDLEFSWGGLKKNPLTNKLCGSIFEIGAVKFNNGKKEWFQLDVKLIEGR